MKIIIKKTFKGIVATFILCIGLLFTFVFNPTFLYAEETNYENFTIYHNKPLNEGLTILLKESLSELKNHEIYNDEITIRVCLNDGSIYPDFIKNLIGPDVIRSFANISVVHADILDIENNKMIFTQWNNESFKASQMFMHSFTHCLQYQKYGFWGSNPIANHEEWKWEGYAEYTSFGVKYELKYLINRYTDSENEFWVEMNDGSKTLRRHIQFLAMIKFCIEIKQMSYAEILESKKTHEEVYSDLTSWYKLQNLPKTK